jgi:hypothetical protein
MSSKVDNVRDQVFKVSNFMHQICLYHHMFFLLTFKVELGTSTHEINILPLDG